MARLYHETDKMVYVTIEDEITGERWNADTLDWEALTVANHADYATEASETPADSYEYVVTLPEISGNMTARWLRLRWYEQADEEGDPAIDDEVLAEMIGYWDGTTFRIHVDSGINKINSVPV